MDINLPETTGIIFVDVNSNTVDWEGTAADAIESNTAEGANDVVEAIRGLLRTGEPVTLGGGATPAVRVAVEWTGDIIGWLPFFYVINPGGRCLERDLFPQDCVELGVPQWVVTSTNSEGHDACAEVLDRASSLGVEVLCMGDDRSKPFSIDFVVAPDRPEEESPEGTDIMDAAADLANAGVCLTILPDWLPERVGEDDPVYPGQKLLPCGNGRPPCRVYAVKSYVAPATKAIQLTFNIPAGLDTPSEVLLRMRDIIIDALEAYEGSNPNLQDEELALVRALLTES